MSGESPTDPLADEACGVEQPGGEEETQVKVEFSLEE
jgi:hypothetical protein